MEPFSAYHSTHRQWVDRIDVARFSQGEMSGWQAKIFSDETHYSLQKLNGHLALQAVSNAAASGRYREIDIDLSKTPMLHWSWMVNNTIPDINESTRSGDDYAARVYVVFSGGIAFWRTRAINYVWSSNQTINMHWSSAYTDNVRMIAVQSGQKRLGEWINERRNVRTDYRRLFGEEPGKINAVAIMTDTDNSGASVKAWYGDIWFGLVWFGLVWFGLVWFGLVWFGMNCNRQCNKRNHNPRKN